MQSINSTSSNIRAEARRRGMTGEELAAAIGISPATYWRRMSSNGWKVAEVELIAVALGVDPSALTRKQAA